MKKLKEAGYVWIEAPEGKEIELNTKGESAVFTCRVEQTLDDHEKVEKSTMSFTQK